MNIQQVFLVFAIKICFTSNIFNNILNKRNYCKYQALMNRIDRLNVPSNRCCVRLVTVVGRCDERLEFESLGWTFFFLILCCDYLCHDSIKIVGRDEIMEKYSLSSKNCILQNFHIWLTLKKKSWRGESNFRSSSHHPAKITMRPHQPLDK